MTLEIQFVTLGMMCAGGLSLGGLFDVYRVLSGQLRAPLWLKSALDLVYWFVGTLLVFKLLYESNWGEVRPFIFLGLGIGICIYFLLFSRTVIRIIRLTIRAVLAISRFIQRIFIIFVVKPLIGIYKLTLILFGFLAATAIFMYKIVLQLLYPLWKMLLWLLKPLTKWIKVPISAWLKKTGMNTMHAVRRFFGLDKKA